MKTRSNQSYDHKSEAEYNTFLDNYNDRISKTKSEKYLLQSYDRNNFVRGHTLHREDRIIANRKIEIIKKRLLELLQTN